jgi:Ca-activated chloride channel family protein
MDQKLKKILQDIYLVTPELTDNEEELKKTIEKLLYSKPKQEIDPVFKQELLDKILVEYGKPGPQQQVKRPFYLRPAFITVVAASLFVAALGIGIQLFMSKRVTKPSIVITAQDQTQNSEVRKTRDPVKPNPGKRSTKNTISPEDEEILRNLGYLGGDTGTVSTGTGVSLPRQRHSYQYQSDANTESYDYIKDNSFIDALKTPLSTFSIDVDTASYANVRRFLMDRRHPPMDAVRIEELINYFPYDYPIPDKDQAFSITTEISTCPWKPGHQLVLIGMRGQDMKEDELPPSNLVFLLDVSGSMDHPQKLPLLVKAFKLLTHELLPEDQVSIVVYAGSAGLVLPSTRGNNKDAIFAALNRLQAGGSTAGGEGIILAYDTAEKNLIKNGNNRVILATDGDFNVGPSGDAEMVRLIEEKRKKGIFLTVLGFGMGNYKDSKMEKLADKGNGNYFYIDSLLEANKVLVNDLRKTLFTIAKDVKIQVEFNPAKIKSYRLLGYENRLLAEEDFDDDTRDAGEIGAGHTVTALYEIIPVTKTGEPKEDNELKYQQRQIKPTAFASLELMNIKIRYKEPDGDKSSLISKTLQQEITPLEKTSDNFRFASGVAELGLLLRNSKYKGEASFISVLKWARSALAEDKYGYRTEFIRLVRIAQDINKTSSNE